MKLLTIIVALFVLGLSAAAWSQDLSGRWYGEGYQSRRYVHWLAVQGADGQLQIEFREYDECKLVVQSREAGRWRVANGVLLTDVYMLDGQRVDYHERYRLEKVEADALQYRHLRTGTVHQSRRVGEDFEWPACDPSKLVS